MQQYNYHVVYLNAQSEVVEDVVKQCSAADPTEAAHTAHESALVDIVKYPNAVSFDIC